MSKKEVAIKTNPSLWKRIIEKVKRGSKYGKPNSWNARKAQYSVKLYKESGGSYKGKKSPKNSLTKWTKQDWKYSSKEQEGKGRYLPKKVWDKLTPKEKEKKKQKKKQANSSRKTKAHYSKKIGKLVKNA